MVQHTATQFGAESTLIGMAVALLLCALLVDRLWRLRHLAQSADPGEEEVREAASRGAAGLRAERAADRGVPLLDGYCCADSRVFLCHGGRCLAVQGHCRSDDRQGQERADRVLWQLHLLHRRAVADAPVAGDLAAAAAVRTGRGADDRARGAGARVDRPAGLELAGRGDHAARQRPGAALFDRPARDGAAVPPAPGRADPAGEVVHRHRRVAAGGRTLGRRHPASGHGAALARGADLLGQPAAPGRVAGGGLGRAAAVRHQPREEHQRPPPARAAPERLRARQGCHRDPDGADGQRRSRSHPVCAGAVHGGAFRRVAPGGARPAEAPGAARCARGRWRC